MRNYLLCGLMLAFAGVSYADDAKVEKYENKAGKYKVTFPAKPEISENKADSALGKLTFTMAMWSSKEGDKVMMVSFVDYPVGKEEFDAEKGLEGAAEGAMKNPANKLVGEVEKIKFGADKLPGRKFVMQNEKQKLWGTNMMIIKGTRMYHVMVLGDKAFATGKDAEKFLGSFEITDEKSK